MLNVKSPKGTNGKDLSSEVLHGNLGRQHLGPSHFGTSQCMNPLGQPLSSYKIAESIELEFLASLPLCIFSATGPDLTYSIYPG